MNAIDWEDPDVQRIYSEELYALIEEDIREQAALDALHVALADVPDVTWRMRLRLAYWDFRDALERVRLYP